MLKAQKLLLQIPVLLPIDPARGNMKDDLSGQDVNTVIGVLRNAGATMGTIEVVSTQILDRNDAAVAIAGAGADLDGFVTGAAPPLDDLIRQSEGDPTTVMFFKPDMASSSTGELVEGATVIIARPHPDGGWTAIWGVSDQGLQELPNTYSTSVDAVQEARRRYEASRDPEAEADEFEDGSHADPFDATIQYGAIFIDDENQWRGRWYRGEWSSEGEYTELLYDTPGQARRAARRLRTTGDES